MKENPIFANQVNKVPLRDRLRNSTLIKHGLNIAHDGCKQIQVHIGPIGLLVFLGEMPVLLLYLLRYCTLSVRELCVQSKDN